MQKTVKRYVMKEKNYLPEWENREIPCKTENYYGDFLNKLKCHEMFLK